MISKCKGRHKLWVGISILVLCFILSSCIALFAQSKQDDETISEGIHIESVDVSGMTYEEALSAVNEYVNGLGSTEVNLHVNENTVTVPVSELGFSCSAEAVVEHAINLGKSGNIVKRYKEKKELEVNGSVIDLAPEFSVDAIKGVLEEKCKKFDVKAVDAGLKKTESGFVVTEGQNGVALDVDASVTTLKDFLASKWDGNKADVDLVTAITEPRSAGANLDKVGDLLGSATTSYSSSGKARCGNVERGASLINGTLLYPGEEFSAYETISPITLDNGYFMAASYENGQVVESPGGGICQVSTTLYNAILKSELEVKQRSNHSMIVTYVDPSKDAAIAGTYKDFKFVNNTEYPIYIEGITAGKKITFNVYGVETRDPSRTVEYISETVSQTEPATKLNATGDNFGHISTSQSSHKGLVAQLWKVVYKNGVEESREVINHSTYNASPRIVNVGTANASPEAMNELNAAIAANDEGAVRAVIAKYASANPPEGGGAGDQPDGTGEGVLPDPNQPADGQPTEQQPPAEGQPTEQQPPAEQQPTEQQPSEGQPAPENQ